VGGPDFFEEGLRHGKSGYGSGVIGHGKETHHL
jgi:hypothetical protein